MTKLQKVTDYLKDQGFHSSEYGLDVHFCVGRQISHYRKHQTGTGFFAPEKITLASSEIRGHECVEAFFSLNVAETLRLEVYKILNQSSAPAATPGFGM